MCVCVYVRRYVHVCMYVLCFDPMYTYSLCIFCMCSSVKLSLPLFVCCVCVYVGCYTCFLDMVSFFSLFAQLQFKDLAAMDLSLSVMWKTPRSVTYKVPTASHEGNSVTPSISVPVERTSLVAVSVADIVCCLSYALMRSISLSLSLSLSLLIFFSF